MKKFSMNLLKVVVVLIIGICALSLRNTSNAAKKIVNKTVSLYVGESKNISGTEDKGGFLDDDSRLCVGYRCRRPQYSIM